MRLVFITGSYPPLTCGVGDYTAMLAETLAEKGGLDVTVLTSIGAHAQPEHTAVRVLPLVTTWRLAELRKIRGRVAELQPDLIHLQYPTQGYGRRMMPSFLPAAIGTLGIPVVQTWHEPLSWKGWFRYLPNALTRDTLVVVERAYQSFLPSWYRWLLMRKRVEFVPVFSNIPVRKLSSTERDGIRSRFGKPGKNMIAYFGFVHRLKGVEKLFEIADPRLDHLVVLSELNDDDHYQHTIRRLTQAPRWASNVTVTGFLPAEEVAGALAAADAAVFPFLNGVSLRNASVLAARIQGTFVLTTSGNRRGYCAEENTYYASPDDCSEMRTGLRAHLGTNRSGASLEGATRHGVARRHLDIYRAVLLAQP